MTRKAERVNALYDYAADRPDGFTNVEAMDEFDWTLREFNAAVRSLRLVLGEDEITLPCDPSEDDPSGPWVYKLVGTYDEARPWAVNRLKDSESRLATIEAVAAAVMNATDGRTTEGKKARLIHSTTAYLREQLEMLDVNGR